MDQLVDCQYSMTRWGEKAKFKKAKLGLARDSSIVYLIVFTNTGSKPTMDTYNIDPKVTQLLPSAIKFHDIGKDMFIKEPTDEGQFKLFVRKFKIILNQERIKLGSKAENLRKFISHLPLIEHFREQRVKISKNLNICRRVAKFKGDYAGGIRPFDDITDHENTNSLQISQSFSTKLASCRKQLEYEHLGCITIDGYPFIPRELWFRTSLRELTLTHCNLKTVPKQIEIFSSSLSFLDLSHNKIKNVARSFCGTMNILITLDLSYNNIETLPIEIKFFRRLANLNLSHNQLRMLPSTFSDLKRLRYLNVANNNLSQLPAFRRQEINLAELDVSYNPLDGGSDKFDVFEVHPSYDDDHLWYQENLLTNSKMMFAKSRKCPPKLFEIALLELARDDRVMKLASQISLPDSIVTTIQREIFKCHECGQLNLLPAYNATDCLDYVQQVGNLITNGNFIHGMTFMRLICRTCFNPQGAK